jgi:hypothetical protein
MDYKNLPPELVKKLKDWESKRPEQQQLKVLADIANMTQELISVADDTGKATTDVSKQLSALGAVLDDSRQQLMQLNKKEAPESPDYAKPVVSALDRVIAEIKKQDIKPVFSPEIKVSSPKVELPKIDLKGIERLLKTEIPKAFKDSIKLIPQTVIPEQDDAEMQLLIQELIAVTTEVRDKRIPIPQFPNKIAVTNPDGSLIGGSTTWGISDIEATATYKYFGFQDASANWYIMRKTIATKKFEYAAGASAYSTAWTNRASQTYTDYATAF